MYSILSLATAFCAFGGFVSVDGISTLSITGSKFFNAAGQQVFFKGIAYQRSPYDPFVNATQCQLDAALMKTLGANAIRSNPPPSFTIVTSSLPDLLYALLASFLLCLVYGD